MPASRHRRRGGRGAERALRDPPGRVVLRRATRAASCCRTPSCTARARSSTERRPYAALRRRSGLRSILESSIYGESVTGAAIVEPAGRSSPAANRARSACRCRRGPIWRAAQRARCRAAARDLLGEGQTLEVRQPMTLGDEAFGSIRIGVSTLLMRRELNESLRPALLTRGGRARGRRRSSPHCWRRCCCVRSMSSAAA